MHKANIEKLVFWDYGPGALDTLPSETVAQRLVDRWPAIDLAFRDKKLGAEDIRDVLRRIQPFLYQVDYCENIRKWVIHDLVEKHAKDIA